MRPTKNTVVLATRNQHKVQEIRALLADLARVVRAEGLVVLEIGAGQGAAVGDLLVQNGFGDHARHADLAGIERCISALPEKNSERR